MQISEQDDPFLVRNDDIQGRFFAIAGCEYFTR